MEKPTVHFEKNPALKMTTQWRSKQKKSPGRFPGPIFKIKRAVLIAVNGRSNRR
ncbi:hypothetical protein C943_04320 [Mariniradius saccharolyticus AK6]|uniref:Uncharacterized protein n=1 Tax=Mariniradius saccharolyticus AK6 TaxID=1239962 RepID=M7XY85_9BACT|nr:hypothetical protein C943_04320 [Mariniradius saccharolyticus AK6]